MRLGPKTAAPVPRGRAVRVQAPPPPAQQTIRRRPSGPRPNALGNLGQGFKASDVRVHVGRVDGPVRVAILPLVAASVGPHDSGVGAQRGRLTDLRPGARQKPGVRACEHTQQGALFR